MYGIGPGIEKLTNKTEEKQKNQNNKPQTDPYVLKPDIRQRPQDQWVREKGQNGARTISYQNKMKLPFYFIQHKTFNVYKS